MANSLETTSAGSNTASSNPFPPPLPTGRPRVVVIGAGFGGLSVARGLAGERVQVTVVDRTNHHLFQPLLYQVAMAGLSPAEIAWPIRSILRRDENAAVVLAEVKGIDLQARTVLLNEESLSYDFLVVAAGGKTSYYGHKEWEAFAPGLKDLDDAVEIRRRVLLAFEAAERETHPDELQKLLTFVVVGGGPTGVELAGALAELANYVLARDFRRINPHSTRVMLIEGGERVLGAFSPEVSAKALEQLQQLGVQVQLKARVTRIDENGVYLGDQFIPSRTIIWGAGIEASPLGKLLAAPVDRMGRVIVEPDLTIPNHKEVFVIGDMANYSHQTGSPLPGVSPVAMQQGEMVAKNIMAALNNKPYGTFQYVDKGSMATIGRSRAVAQMGKLELSGFMAWMAWLLVHIFFLIGFRNRAVVLFNWTWSYFTYGRGARLITGRVVDPEEARRRAEKIQGER